MSRDKEERRQQQQRPEGSLLYSSGNWRPPGASLLPNPLNSLGRPGSAARPSWAAATRREAAPAGTAGLPTGGAKTAPDLLAAASRTIDESALFRPLDVITNAYVNSAAVEERAVEQELQRQTLLFSDQPKASRPQLTSMLSYLTNNNASSPSPGAGGRASEHATLTAPLSSGIGALYGTGFDAIPEEVSAASLQFAEDSPLRPVSASRGRVFPSAGGGTISPVSGASAVSPHPLYNPPPAQQQQQPPAGPARRPPPGDPWFGPASSTIGRSERPSSAWLRPVSAQRGGRPVSAISNGGGGGGSGGAVSPPPLPGAPSPKPPSPDQNTIEGRLAALSGTAGTGRRRGQSPPGQWARPSSSTGGGARPISAPRPSYGSLRPGSATLAAAAAAAATGTPFASSGGAAAAASAVAAKTRRRASGSQAMEASSGGSGSGGSRTTLPWRPLSAVPYNSTSSAGASAGGSGGGAPALLGRPASFSAAVSHGPDSPPGTLPPLPPRPLSPTRSHWLAMRSGGGDDSGGGGGGPSPPRPGSAVPVALTSTVVVATAAATMAEAAGQPPVPYRSRHEFLHSGKRIPTGCRPLSAFSTLSSATRPLGGLASVVSTVSAGGSPPRGNGCVVPLSQSVAYQPVYQDEEGPIKTSFDVVDYFSQHGQNATKKLFYLMARKPVDLMDVVSPFELVVVPFERVDRADYWTMSALGAVHVEGDRTEEGEFIPLGEWMRLNTVYGLLRKMRFFRHFLLVRSFRRWRANVKRTAFERTRAAVGARLFAVSPTFQPALNKAAKLVGAMRDTAVVAITARLDRLYTLEEFVGEQDNRRHSVAAPSLAGLSEALAAEILAVGTRVAAELERMERGVDIAALRANEFVTHIPVGPSTGGRTAAAAAAKSKSISALRAEKEAILAKYDAWVAAKTRMPQFVRLLDYLVACTAVDLGIRGTQELLSYLDNPAKTRGVLLVTVSFEPKDQPPPPPQSGTEGGAGTGPLGYSFTPKRRQVREGLSHVMDALVSMLADMPRPSTSKAVATKYISEGESFFDVASLVVEGSALYQQLREGILAHVETSFDKALDYVRATFEDKRPIYEFALAWDAAAYDMTAAGAAIGLQGYDTLSATFRKDLLQQRRWQRQVDQMKMSNTVGILYVDSKKMRAALQDSIENILDDIKSTMMSTARRAVVTAQETLRQWIKDVEPRPEHLDGYATMRELHSNLLIDQDLAFKVVDAATDMYELYRDYGGKHDVKDAVALETLHETGSQVRGQLGSLGEWVRERLPAMVTELASAVQDLTTAIMLLLSDITSPTLADPEADVMDMLDLLAGLELRLLEAEEAARRYTRYQALFGQPRDEPGNLPHVRREFDHRKAAWGTTAEWAERTSAWLHSPCGSLDPEAISGAVDEYQRSTYKLARAARDDRVVAKLKDSIDSFRRYLQLFSDACNSALQPHHWAQILGLLGQTERDPAEPITVSELIEWGALSKAEPINNISGAASKESSLLQALRRMKDDWVGVEFKMVPYKDTGTCVVGHTDDIQIQLDEQLMKIQAMNASPFVKPFKAEAEAWQQTLEGLEELLERWLSCQATWMYLEPIFSSPDIVKQMPEEGEKFATVDMTFRLLVDEVVASPAAIKLAKDADRRDSLALANRLLDEVQRGLSRYLEAKRLAFPRFFFLSNDEMLEILSETKDPTRVQPHLRKCFEGIHRLQFEPGPGGVVSAMISLEGEKVSFKHPINTSMARGKVEQWLVEVEAAMFEAVHDVTGRGINDLAAGSGGGSGPPRRHEWALRWPGMVVLLAAGVFWTRGVEAALGSGRLQDYEKRCSSELREIVDLVRGELTGLQRATLGALVVMDVHGRDVVSALAAEGVADPADFGWQAQLRSYWHRTDGKLVPGQPQRDWTARICMMSASLEYGYEYLGNSSRLVITPLTDRCYRTLMGAIHLNLGGAPEGPAGTGKTETTKDLAKALARQCVVFNCSDTLNHMDMAKFFKGLAAAGAWACFDEFNRIDLEVLSVVAQQVLDIQRAIAARVTLFTFEGTDLPLKWSAWVAITMNPGYAGRTELPDNLKALFRSVAMMVPDYAMIAEIILYSYGYLAARPAAKKIVACYKLCSEQLSSQDHYDYGMRAVMAVLRAAGNLKRTLAPPPEVTAAMSPEQQETEELALVLRSLVDVNLCKFLSHDVPLFNGIVSDLFPGITLPRTDYGPLADALRSACTSANLQPTEYFMLKATQLYEMVLVRHGLMLVGQPFSGKTTAYRTLAAALSLVADSAAAAAAAGGLGRTNSGELNPHAKQVRTNTFVLNPKAVTMGQLYGQNDPASHEWTDGVLAVLFRRCAADPSPERKWLVLDGPVDAVWIENMNTVLDDNKKLCLNSGEIIAMSPPMNLIFEVGDLSAASPATVSRCGMVYLEPQQLGTAPLVASWLAACPPHWGNVPTAAAAAAGSGITVAGGASSLLGPGAGGMSVLGLGSSVMMGSRLSVTGAALGGLPGGSTSTLGLGMGGELLSGLKARLAALFEGLVVPTIRFVRREVRECAPSLDGNLATSWMRLVSALLMPVIGTAEQYRKASMEGRTLAVADAVGLMALVWSVGCTAATQEGRALVDAFVRRALSGTLSGLEAPSGHVYGISDAPSVPLLSPSAAPPETGLLYDYMYDVSVNSWVAWSSLAASSPPIPSDARYSSILVPTSDTAAITFLLTTAISGRYPFLLVGPTGTGKSVTVTRCLLQLDGEVFAPPNLIGFSGQTSANSAQALVDAKLDKRRRGTYGPSGGRRGVVFVDDLNMPQREVYGAQPPIELLRQLIDQGGWYGRDNAFRTVQDVLLVAAMGPPGGGREPVTNRFTRHFATICLPEATRETLAHIFGTIQGWFLASRGFPQPVAELRDSIIAATLDVYSAAVQQLLPTPAKSHYTFNLRDCSRVVQGMQAQDAEALRQSAALMRPLVGGGGGAAGEGELVWAHLRLWVHEVLRVFYDRLVEVSEQQWLLDLLRELLPQHFGVKLDDLLAHLLTHPEEVEGPEGQQAEGGDGAKGHAAGAPGGGRVVDPSTIRRCLFGDYMTDTDAEGNPRPYTEIPSPAAAVARLEDLQADYNGLGGGGGKGPRPRLQLAVFLYALEHVTRISRVLRQEGGHVLCVGVGGSGRQSLARLAAFISGMDAFQIEISRSYGLNEWREDLRRLTRSAGAAEKRTVFLFGDSQAAQETFVEDVNSLINSGEVPNLFPHEERAAICEAVRAAAKRADPSGPDSPAALWAFFLARCRANLHVVLCFSPAGDAFRERLRRFPALVNCCTIDWFHAWPDDALDAVAAKLLTEVDLEPDVRMRVKDLCKAFHAEASAVSTSFHTDTGRHNYVTPTSFLELISCFGRLLRQRREQVLTQQQKYENGLDKLQFTAEQVTVMRNELQALSPVLARTVAETEQLLSEIAREKEQVVEPKRALVDKEVKQADASAAAARVIKEECQAILKEALPALEAAIQALDTIKAADLKIVQTFKSPPAAVKAVMEAVCVLLDVKPTLLPDPNMAGRKIVDWWDASKRLLMDPQLIQRLKDYDRDNIPQRIIDKIRKEYTGDPDFTPANAAKASSAAEGLCKWVYAMDQYDRVAKVVAPKRAALVVAEAEYGSVLQGLHAKQSELRALEAKLAGLEKRLEESQARKARLEADTQACALKLERAEQLLGGLGGEKERWTQAAAALRAQMGGITGDMLLAAGAVAYLGAFTMPYRERALSSWCEAVGVAGVRTSASTAPGGAASGVNFSLTAVLGEPVTIREWVIHGLPNDSFSIDSAVIAANSRRWPLCIDPQGQANRWIKSMNESKKMKVMKLTDPDYLRALEAAISYGLPVLLENVGEVLDPSLDPLLLRQTFRQGGSTVLRLGDNVVEYSPEFRLYMTTALRNPHYLPETAVKVALLNFMITPEGLSDQLLGVAVAAEMPQLEEQRQTLVVASADNARQLAEIEARILAVLSTTEGNLLEDATAVSVLSEAKRLSDDISAKQAVAERTQSALDAARRRYRPLAEVAATVFFAIADLAGVDSMYQYSLAWFIGLFVRSIQASATEAGGGGGGGGGAAGAPGGAGPVPGPTGPAGRASSPPPPGRRASSPTPHGPPTGTAPGALEGPDLGARLQAIERHFLYASYCNVSRSLFERDKLLLSFLLASRLAAHRGKLPPEQMRFLIQGGGAAAAAAAAAEEEPPEGLPPRTWAEVKALAALPGGTFAYLPTYMQQRAEQWAALVEAAEPHARPLPDPVDSMLGSFQRLLVLRCLRPDKLVPALEGWVAGELGPQFVSPPPLDLAAAFVESSSVSVPLLFVLSPGTDPWVALLRFAEEREQAGKLQVISLGQGQGPKAEAMIESARRMGSWVLLQNCHLAPSWMPALERIWEAIREDNTDPGFRLWLTSMPTTAFPSTLLQASVKMTYEPPAGLRSNMRRSLALEPLSDHLFWELEGVGGPHSRSATPVQRSSEGGDKRRGGRGVGGGGGGGEAPGSPAAAPSPPTLKRLLFGLVFLHAAVQERRRYGPIGWNVPYGFDDGDLRISARQMRMYVQDSVNRSNPVPYEALRYAIGECNYGGRVTDDKDRRLLATMLRRIVAPETVDTPRAELLTRRNRETDDDGFGAAFSHLKAAGFGTAGGPGAAGGQGPLIVVVPDTTTLEGFVAYVDSLPSSAPPDVFGLHPNADISKDLATTNDLLASLTSACGGLAGGLGGAGGGASATAATAAAGTVVQDILERLPADFNLEQVAAAYPVLYHQSMNQVLVQEMSRYNRLLGLLRNSLTQLGRAVAGLQLLSPELEAVLAAVAAGQVPAAWKANSYPSLKPLGPYISDLLARLSFLSDWAAAGPPAAFWIGAFFFPPAFTTAALQNFARHHTLPIDAVGFDFEVLRAQDASSLTAPPPAGVFVHGLYLEGAAWDRSGGCLEEQAPKQLHCAAPPIWFKPVKLADLRPTASYDCPVYRTADRRGVLATTGHSTNFLMTVGLPLGVSPSTAAATLQQMTDHWTLRGVCMLVSLPE